MCETKVADGEEVVRSMTTTTVLTGAGLPKLFKKWPELEERALKSEKWSPSAESVGRIGYQRWLAGQAIDPMELKLPRKPTSVSEAGDPVVLKASEGPWIRCGLPALRRNLDSRMMEAARCHPADRTAFKCLLAKNRSA